MMQTEAKTLNLLFPQWQGSSLADADRLITGAQRLRALFPQEEFVALEVPAEGPGATVSGIRSRNMLSSQMASARRLIERTAPEHILTLGGDCSVDLAPVAYLNERYDDLAVLWLDAHPDLNTPQSSPSGALHGMILRFLLGEGAPDLGVVRRPLEPQQVFLAGVRNFDPPERAYVDEKAIWHGGVADLEASPSALIESIKARGFSRVHLHFDLDALDPRTFAGTGYPTAAGFSLPAATRLLQELGASFEIVGITLTEYLPQLGGEAGERVVLETLVGSLPRL